MADPPSSPATQQPEPDNPKRVPTPSTPPPPSTSAIPQQQQSATPLDPNQNPNPNPNSTPIPNPAPLVPPPTSISPYPLPAQPMSAASLPSFRPVPQFAPLPNYQNPSVGVPPPGVTAVPAAGSVSVPPPVPFLPYPLPPGQQPNPALRPPFAPLPNGYPVPQGTIPPPGIARYPAPYPAMARPIFPPRPPGAPGLLPVAPRPLLPGIPGVRPVISPIRPAVPSVRPAEKPQTTVYVGKIAPTVEDDFMLSVLQLCGPVKSWKRAPNRGFGFCEFESAEGVLRSLRLLSKFNIDAQELMLNVDKATREYLERYVEKKKENAKNLDAQAVGNGTEGSNSTVQKSEPLKASTDDASNDGETENKEDNNEAANFGIVTDEDKQGDREALDKLYSLREERLKTRPLPPPPPPPQAPADSSANSNTELPAKSKADSDGNATKNDEAEEKNDENRTTNEQERLESLSPDRNRRHDRRSRDRERDVKREKEREIERLEREAERERVRKEREQRRKIEEAEREYEERLKDWEYREREKEKQRQYEKEKEKERERKRRKEIIHDEEDEDDDSRKRWRRNTLEEKRRKRLREKEEDIEDRLKEEEEIAEAQRRAEEEMLQKQQRDALKVPSDNAMNGSEKPVMVKEADENIKEMVIEQASEFGYGKENHRGDVALQNGNVDEHEASKAESDVQHSNNALTKKLGFGLVGSGKRAAVPSVFNEEDDDEANKDKKMRPLVPIDYSMEELQAVQQQVPGVAAPNLIAAAEYAKRISSSNPKEEKSNMKRDRSKYSHDRSSRRDRDRKDEDVSRSWDEKKEKNTEQERDRENRSEKVKTPDTQRLLDAKQLIDMIPKTKEELFSYEINWAIYDKNQLQERMRPWISKKITEFLGEEETTLVDFIVSSTSEHVKASEMLEMLQSILDEEAEMFVLKMWRMLIFEIKKVETGLHLRSKS